MQKRTRIKQTLNKANPKLARQWHPTKNAPLTPGDVTPGSRKRVWWVCSKGHEWEASIYKRNIGRGCHYCTGQKVYSDNCLQTVNPVLARQWHPTKNAPLTPKGVTAYSRKRVWWICENGHEWETCIADRARGEGCPYCSCRRLNKDNCLLAVKPALARQWHPTKNAPLTPGDVAPSTAKKVWWICKKGHEWEASPNNRSRGEGCPYCAGKKAGEDNCLLTVNPKLARQWHPTKNAPLTPRDVTRGSAKLVWWLCEKDHEWQTSVNDRGKKGCPYCSGRYATKEHNLQATKAMFVREWHTTKNAPLMPRDVTPRSNRTVWWICKKGHEWKARIYNRSKGVGCPYCAGKKASKDNCLQTLNSALARQWHPTKNAPLTPGDVTTHAGKKVWWTCSRGHEWQANIRNRSNGRGCPYCAGKKPTSENCLETICPRFTREWHPTKNEPLTPRDVGRTSQRNIWWRCGKKHVWQETVVNRFRGFGCPVCILREKYPQKTRHREKRC